MHTSMFIMYALVTIEIRWRKQRFLSLVIYGLLATFGANIEKLYIKLKLTSSSISHYGWKLVECVFKNYLTLLVFYNYCIYAS